MIRMAVVAAGQRAACAGLKLLQACGTRGLRLSAVAATETQVSLEPAVDTEENDIVCPNFVNRNPRNLERMALAMKDRGWETQWPPQQYWHRLRYERSQHHVMAWVEHYNGKVVLSASTKEWALKRHLYSTRDVMASENVGWVLAQRCLEAGISYVRFWVIPWHFRCESVQRFRNAMKEGGVVLSEPKRIFQ
ncbi:39S ribosomal protein L18, mitochondrial [Latimeria chalumnae]|uniref:Large ribosomal subunit protein uL18m n=1 Tax=Latimeria chalumnae TaxID=7897 RepID=H3AVJ5_LATCH|nr:PREDICTED: 39S ribosomal protein L18, mitochondrial [Latimeria chalumnae]XP_005999322.1 PREDICTED: 39S ribosomal protein L18, mitochondrial [Latimeria chalumnae]|eukprot:XP_005999321.1 PREDICTED: 39S ribosomal protein L18, mitochondrial [Latimeria chalumnae]